MRCNQFNGVTRSQPVKRMSEYARQIRMPGGGRVSVDAGLTYIQGNSAPCVSVCVEIVDANGNYHQGSSFGPVHNKALSSWPDILALQEFHMWTVDEGPVHYIENAVYWWELAVGCSGWEHVPSDSAAKRFKNQCAWGTAPGDDEDDPLLWTADMVMVEDSVVQALCEDQIIEEQWFILRERLRERLKSRLPALRSRLVKALTDLDIDPEWNPAA